MQRLALVSRGDPLTPYLATALRERFDVVAQVSPELTSRQRALIASLSFHPQRTQWGERYMKNSTGYRLRSANSRTALSGIQGGYDLAFQVHALGGVPPQPYTLYIDCTHIQSAEQWPGWNPLHGRSLQKWFADERSAYRGAAHLFSFCRETTAVLIDRYGVPADRVTTTGAGINLTDLPEPSPRPDDPVLLFVGNDFARKGGHVLLEAFRTVRARLPKARLLIGGTPPQIAPQDGVEILGLIRSRRRLVALYRSATAFTLPSFFEPYGLVLLEAMSFGLPIVATTTCGINDIVAENETGHLVAPGDVDALAAALIRVLGDPAHASRLGERARQVATTTMRWSDVVERMMPGLAAATGDLSVR